MMNAKTTGQQGLPAFEACKKTDATGSTYWSGRELAKLLGYTEYNGFLPAVNKAILACRNSGQKEEDHFESTNEIMALGNETKRKYPDIKLSQYGTYLCIQNADPAYKAVALGQTYFAVQARMAELRQMEQYNGLRTAAEKRQFLREKLARHNLQLAAAARSAGIVKPSDYALFQNHGYMGLYGGLDAQGIREKKKLGPKENILDHMESTELAANLFRATQTEQKLTGDNVHGIEDANSIHFAVGLKVRNAMEQLGSVLPEDLPVATTLKNESKTKAAFKRRDKN